VPLPMLTQPQLITELSDETGWTKSDVRQFLDSLETVITANLQKGQRVKVAGIQVECKLRSKLPQRKGRNPATGKTITIEARPASVILKAKPVAPLSQIELPTVRAIQRML